MKIKKAALIPLILLIFVAVALTAVTAGVLVAQQNVPATGTVGGNVMSSVNIGVYSDSQAITRLENIDWGDLEEGTAATKTIYIKNTGNISETLSLTANNWNPAEAGSSLFLTWSHEGAVLQPNEVVAATLTLTVAQDAGSLTSFSLNIVISGTA